MGAQEGQYGFRRRQMGSCERAVICLESQAVSARVTNHFVTILLKLVSTLQRVPTKSWRSSIDFAL